MLKLPVRDNDIDLLFEKLDVEKAGHLMAGTAGIGVRRQLRQLQERAFKHADTVRRMNEKGDRQKKQIAALEWLEERRKRLSEKSERFDNFMANGAPPRPAGRHLTTHPPGLTQTPLSAGGENRQLTVAPTRRQPARCSGNNRGTGASVGCLCCCRDTTPSP